MEEQPQGVQTRPTTACLRCRVQKLKCGRELPTCERCRKQDAACTYPAPPDRKQIAAEKSNRTKASQLNSSKHLPRPDSPSAETNTAKRRRSSHDTAGPFNCLAEPDAAELPSTEIGLLLQEVYFKRVYNADLMFHKTVGMQVYMLNKTPEYLLRAMFAHAALFLQEVDPEHQKYIKVYPMQTLYERSWSWAHAASVQVLSHADEPSVLKTQALQVLQLYYYARGEIVRAKVHLSLAYRMAQLLGYDKLYENEDLTLTNPSLKFDHEIRRRSFWASWSTMCLDSDGIYAPQIYESAADLPLPAKFGAGGSIQGVDLTVGQKMSREWRGHGDSQAGDFHTASLMAQLVKLTGFWAKIRGLMFELRTRGYSQRMDEFQEVGMFLEEVEIYVDFPASEIFARAKSFEQSPEFLACVCSIYYLSRIFSEAFRLELDHLSIAKLRDGNPVIQSSSETPLVVEQALRFTELLQQLVSSNLDITRLWHVTGYVAFIAAKVILFYHTVQKRNETILGSLQVPGPDSSEISVNQTVLQVLSLYWQPLHALVTNLNESIEMARSSPEAFLSFPWDYINFLSDGKPNPEVGYTAEIPQLAIDKQGPLQENTQLHIEHLQSIGAGFLPIEVSASRGPEGHAVEKQWAMSRPY